MVQFFFYVCFRCLSTIIWLLPCDMGNFSHRIIVSVLKFLHLILCGPHNIGLGTLLYLVLDETCVNQNGSFKLNNVAAA